MFLDYLKNKESEVINEIKKYKKELNEVELKIKENHKFYEMIESGKTTPFTEFTPQVITASDKRKQQDLVEEKSILLKKKEEISSKIALLEVELENIGSAITDAISKISELKKVHSIEKKEIISRINKILETNISDPMRSNIELKELLKFLEDK